MGPYSLVYECIYQRNHIFMVIRGNLLCTVYNKSMYSFLRHFGSYFNIHKAYRLACETLHKTVGWLLLLYKQLFIVIIAFVLKDERKKKIFSFNDNGQNSPACFYMLL